jgi:hypothetical protein
MGLSIKTITRPFKQAKKVVTNPLKAVRDVTGYTEMKEEVMRKQREQEALAEAAQGKQLSSSAKVADKERRLRLEEARKVSSRRSASGGRGRGYRSLLSPYRIGGVVPKTTLGGTE